MVCSAKGARCRAASTSASSCEASNATKTSSLNCVWPWIFFFPVCNGEKKKCEDFFFVAEHFFPPIPLALLPKRRNFLLHSRVYICNNKHRGKFQDDSETIATKKNWKSILIPRILREKIRNIFICVYVLFLSFTDQRHLHNSKKKKIENRNRLIPKNERILQEKSQNEVLQIHLQRNHEFPVQSHLWNKWNVASASKAHIIIVDCVASVYKVSSASALLHSLFRPRKKIQRLYFLVAEQCSSSTSVKPERSLTLSLTPTLTLTLSRMRD